LKGDLEPGFKASHQNKDLRHLISLAYELKVPLPGVSLVHQLFSVLEAEGLGEKGTQALIAVYRKMANLAS
jgi:3-hydroxyisobutyrate dehydrogenase